MLGGGSGIPVEFVSFCRRLRSRSQALRFSAVGSTTCCASSAVLTASTIISGGIPVESIFSTISAIGVAMSAPSNICPWSD